VSQAHRGQTRLPVLVALLLLAIRGVLLWLLVPLALLWWVVAWPVLRRRSVRLAQLLGWADLNLVAAIERSILRPLIGSPLPWVPASELSAVTHRIGFTDPA
jgi:hypothetical protein